jgi:hypothetical protein
MFIYPELNKLLAAFEKVRTFTFFVFGSPNTEEIDILNRGLYHRIIHATEIMKERVVIIIEPILEEQANLLDCFQGTRMIFGIAQNDIDEKLVCETLLDGFDFLRYKVDYLGCKETESHV